MAVIAALAATGLPLCPIAAVTRYPCPGCGLGRATIALARGHVAESLRAHPLAPIVAPSIVGLVAYACAVHAREGRLPAASGRAATAVVIAAVAVWSLLVAVWIARFFGAFGGPVPV